MQLSLFFCPKLVSAGLAPIYVMSFSAHRSKTSGCVVPFSGIFMPQPLRLQVRQESGVSKKPWSRLGDVGDEGQLLWMLDLGPVSFKEFLCLMYGCGLFVVFVVLCFTVLLYVFALSSACL